MAESDDDVRDDGEVYDDGDDRDRRDAIVVYADYVCPFCYLGMQSLESYLDAADDPPAVDWHPFDLRGNKRTPDGDIDAAVDDGKDDAYFEEARRNVTRLQERYGVEMTRDFARDVDSRDAQKVALAVREEHDEETFAAFHDAVFAALWRDERDIEDVDVLVDVAEDVGIPASAVRDAVADDALDDRLDARFDAARRRGVTGVPTFVYGEYAARGAVPPDQIQRLVEG